MRTRRAEVVLGYALELVVSALRGARSALGRMIGDEEDLRPPAPSTRCGDDGATRFNRGAGRDVQQSPRVARERATGDPHTAPVAHDPTRADDAAALRRAFDATPPLPASYGDDRLVLLARDPGTIFAYWDLAPGFAPPTHATDAHLVLRVEDLTLLDFAAARPWRRQDLDIDGLVGSRYVEVAHSGGTYRAQIGWRHRDGSFIARVQSTTVSTPRADAPGHEPLRWMTVQVEGSDGGVGAAPARLAIDEAAAPRSAPTAVPNVPAPTHTSGARVGDRAPSSAALQGRPPSSAELHRGDTSHRRGG